MVSDGLYFKEAQISATGWIIESNDRTGCIKGSTASPGSASKLISYGNKLTGILSALCHVNELCKQHQIGQGQATLYCDGEGSIKTTQECYNIVHNNRKHFNLIHSIQAAVRASPFGEHFTI